MKSFSAVDARNNFGELMDTVQREPVSIEKHGRRTAVMISEEEYEAMKLESLRGILSARAHNITEGKGRSMTIDEISAELDKEFEQEH